MFLLNEDKNHLGNRVNNILTSMQDLHDDMENLGTRHFNRLVDELVNEMRKVLHGEWSARNQKFLSDLQKVAVALKKTLEDKGDLKEIFPAALQSLQNLAGKLGVKVNDVQAPEAEGGQEISQDDFQLTPEEPQQDPNQMQPDPNQMPPDMGQPMPQDPNMGQQPPMPQQPMM